MRYLIEHHSIRVKPEGELSLESIHLFLGKERLKAGGNWWSIQSLGALLIEVVADALNVSLAQGVDDFLALLARYDPIFHDDIIPNWI